MSIHHSFDIMTAQEIAIVPPPAIDAASARAPVMGEAAVPDVPARVGAMIVGAYAAIMGGLVAGFAHSPEAIMMVTISILYTIVYLAVPAAFLRVEATSGRIGFAAFLRKGLDTWTGHLSGREAIVQMLTIPVSVAFAVWGIALVALLNR